jgi:ABC-type transporter Mla subunit MlaD
MPRFGLGLACLAAGLLALPVRGQDSDKNLATLDARLRAMQTQIDETKRQLEQLQRTLDQLVAQVREQRNYQDVKDQLSTAQLELQRTLSELRQLRDQVDQVRRGSATAQAARPLEPSTSLRTQAAMPYIGETSVSGYGGVPQVNPAVGRAVVRVVNSDFRDAVVYLNGQRYIAPAYRTVNLDFSPGELTYTVDLWKPVPTTVTLRPGATFPINIYTVPR